ncbi:dipeptidase 1-like protein [Zopfochytrium polystomum]|nr:dipeptidase 1-like protein [Zopfochytrium polystomum]
MTMTHAATEARGDDEKGRAGDLKKHFGDARRHHHNHPLLPTSNNYHQQQHQPRPLPHALLLTMMPASFPAAARRTAGPTRLALALLAFPCLLLLLVAWPDLGRWTAAVGRHGLDAAAGRGNAGALWSPASGDAAIARLGASASDLDRALALLQRAPVIDGHNDLPIGLQFRNNGRLQNINLTTLPGYHTDITRLREGRVGAQFWSAFVPCNPDYKKKSDDVRFTLEQIDLIRRMTELYPETFAMAYSSADIKKIAQTGRIASLIGLEGGHHIDGSLAVLRQYYSLGARYMTLTHSCNTAWADSASQPPEHNGLTKFGETVIREMNRLGMLIDLSHVSPETMLQAIRLSTAPVVFSHSSAFAVCNSPRNVPDKILKMLKAKDGVVMVNFFPDFVGCNKKNPKNVTLEDVADHVSYIAKLIGAEYVGLGSDFDGIPSTPKGLEDVSKYPNLVAELLRRGLTPAEVIGITGGNLLRVFGRVEQVSRSLKSSPLVEEGRVAVNKTC